MSISRQLALQLIPKDPSLKIWEIMDLTNDVLNSNNADILELFPEEDIRFTKFTEQVIQTQRERDLIYVSNFFTQAYRILFIDILVLKKEPNGHDSSIIFSVHAALERLGSPELLTAGLSDKIVKKYLLLK